MIRTNDKINLTASRINNCKLPPKNKRSFLYDQKQPGLRVQILPSGTKTFQFTTWLNDAATPFLLTVGHWPKISIDAARKKAADAAGKIARFGSEAIPMLKTPKQEKEKLRHLYETWLSFKRKSGTRTSSIEAIESKWRHHILPTIGNRPVATLNPVKIKRWHRSLLEKKRLRGRGTLSPLTCNRCLEIVQAICRHHDLHHLVSGIESFEEESRTRYLNEADGTELHRLFIAINSVKPPQVVKDVIMMLLATGARSAATRKMRWQYVNFAKRIWIIPKSASKNREQVKINLTDEALEILHRRRAEAESRGDDSPWVFPHRTKPGQHLLSIQYWWERIRSKARLEDVWIHDLRRTFGSFMAENDASDLMIARALGQKSTSSAKIYAQIRESGNIAGHVTHATSRIWEEAANGKKEGTNNG